MSDWAVGDLAVCVDAKGTSTISEGRVYRVSAIAPPERWQSGYTGIGLFLEGIGRPCLNQDFRATRFRKIRPDEREACEPEFVQLLKRSKRKVAA